MELHALPGGLYCLCSGMDVYQVRSSARYTVRFNSDWSQPVGPGWSDVRIELIELA